MKTLNTSSKNFDQNLNTLLKYRREKVKSNSVSVTNIIRDIKKNMISQKNLTLFLLSIISMNNKNWNELHPEHLNLILEAYSIYDEGSLIKPIILEILNDLNII